MMPFTASSDSELYASTTFDSFKCHVGVHVIEYLSVGTLSNNVIEEVAQ